MKRGLQHAEDHLHAGIRNLGLGSLLIFQSLQESSSDYQQRSSQFELHLQRPVAFHNT